MRIQFEQERSLMASSFEKNRTVSFCPVYHFAPVSPTDELSIEATSVDPEQTAPIGAV